MAKKTKKMTLERLQRESHFLSISLPYDSREEYNLLEFSNSEDGGLEKKDNYAIPMLDRKNETCQRAIVPLRFSVLVGIG